MSSEPMYGLNQPSPPAYQPQFSPWVRQLLTIMLIVVGVLLLTLIAPVLPVLTIAFLLAFVMFLPSRAIARNTAIPYALVVTLLYTILIALVVVGMLVIIPTLASAAKSLVVTLERGYSLFTDNLAAFDPDDAVFEVVGTRVDLSDIAETLKSVLVQTTEAAANVDPATLEATAPVVETATDTLAPLIDAAANTDPPAAAIIRRDGLTTPVDSLLTASGGTITSTETPGGISLPGGELGNLINQFLSLFGSVTVTLTSAIGSVTGFVVSMVLALFISFLVLLDIPNTQRALAARVPVTYQREMALLIDRMVRVWNGFFRGQVLIGVMIGVLTWLQLSIMGIGSVVILSVITGVISLIPTIGSIIALLPLALVPLIQGSTVFVGLPNGVVALLVVIVNLVINQVIWNVIAPKILGDALELPLPVIIVGVFIGAAAGGILGAFLVAPIMATLRVLFSYLWHKINLEDPFPGEEAPFEWGGSLFQSENRIRRWLRLDARADAAKAEATATGSAPIAHG